jgi:hypothetical protein
VLFGLNFRLINREDDLDSNGPTIRTIANAEGKPMIEEAAVSAYEQASISDARPFAFFNVRLAAVNQRTLIDKPNRRKMLR